MQFAPPPPKGAESTYTTRGVRIPLWVWAVALLAAAVHMAPYLRAAAETPDGYVFTGNLSVSPDYMQYRVWMRQTQVEGPIVRDIFTTEPNSAHLPVPLYWMFGKISAWTGMTPEWTYAWFGAVVAVVFTLVLFVLTRRFLGQSRATPWAFGCLMVGGGLGGYLVLLDDSAWARGIYPISALLLRPLRGEGAIVLFENFRGNYIIQALFDTHFLTFWLVTVLAVYALYLTVQRFTPARLAVTAAAFAFGTFLHVYEGLTLLAITAGVLGMIAVRGAAPRRVLLLTGVVCFAAVAAVLLPIVALVKQAGLPAPSWRGETIVFSVVVLGYPLALGLLVWGFGRYWREGGLDEAFLVGWAVACLAIVLSGPFFPYPDRGTMTLQIPLFIIAAAIWFGRRQRVGPLAAAVVVLLLGSTPVLVARSWAGRTSFDATEQHKWWNPAQQQIVATLGERATREDVLVADQANLRWLAPEYPGVHYAGHFFLTVRFGDKQEELQHFYTSATNEERREFLDRWRVTWLFVDDATNVEPFTQIDGVRLVTRTPVGALLEVSLAERTP